MKKLTKEHNKENHILTYECSKYNEDSPAGVSPIEHWIDVGVANSVDSASQVVDQAEQGVTVKSRKPQLMENSLIDVVMVTIVHKPLAGKHGAASTAWHNRRLQSRQQQSSNREHKYP